LQIKEKSQERRRMKSSDSIASELRNRIRKTFKPKRHGSRPRSGYAFSHERGFGDMISTGRMGSRRRKKAEEQAAKTAVQESNSVVEAPTTSSATGTYKTIPI